MHKIVIRNLLTFARIAVFEDVAHYVAQKIECKTDLNEGTNYKYMLDFFSIREKRIPK